MTEPAETVFASTRALIEAVAPDFPGFLYSRDRVKAAAAAFNEGFDGLLTYAVKANPAPHLIRDLAEFGVGAWDVASPNEMADIRALLPGATLHYNNPVRTKREIVRAHEQFAVRSYSVDHPDQIAAVAGVVPASREVEITIRFKAGRTRRAYDFGSKFGATETEAVALAADATARGYAVSLCFHVGSQCEVPYAYERHIAAAGRIAKTSGIEVTRLNVGGGFPSPYPTSAAPPIDHYMRAIERGMQSTFKGSPPLLIAEPGRFLSAPSTALLLRVKHVREGVAVYLNDGIYGALMELKFMPILPPVRVWRGNQMLEGEPLPMTVFGPTCDSYDSLPRRMELPDGIAADDWIELGLMGAYSQASTTGFNGFSRRDQYFVTDILG
ncbi:MAG TPA: hypothetical protein VMW31_03040 [Devosiaceae bacterium]|nr:hypothetical protein [Devosiaceae bacterium]